VMDDVIISRDSKNWILVCNASNREKLVSHFNEVRKSFDVDFSDQTEATAMAALQGPKVIERLADVLPVDLRNLKRYHFETSSFMGMIKFTVFRSGYTGEDGVEIILPAKMASMAMKMLGGSLSKEEGSIMPAGLGARDTLRLEAGMPLYGHELTEETDPLSAGLNFAVDMTKDFIGAEPLRAIAATCPKQKLVGLELEGNRIARQGAIVKKADRPVGTVTSGTLSPTLQKSIAMAYVDSSLANVGQDLSIDLKGTMIPAKVVKLPFYKRST
jgi:aminomethyltransferase